MGRKRTNVPVQIDEKVLAERKYRNELSRKKQKERVIKKREERCISEGGIIWGVC